MTAVKNTSYSNIKNLSYSQIKNRPYGLDPSQKIKGTLIAGVRQQTLTKATTIVGTKQTINLKGTLETNVIVDNLVPVTNATSISNPLLPTVITNGTVLYSNPSTLPAKIPPQGCSVNFTCSNLIGTISASDVFRWNFNIENSGGTWSTKTNVDLPTYGSSVHLFGLSGVVTKKGFDYSNSSFGFNNGGIFGPRNFNRELIFVLGGNDVYSQNQVNQVLQQPFTSRITTHSDAANWIASVSGINLQWTIPDIPLFTFQPQASQTVGDALSSLAQECGGVVRWNGGNSYIVTFPDVSRGLWTVPDCCLIQSMQMDCSLDLNTGIYTPGVYMIPTLGVLDAGTNALPIPNPPASSKVPGSINQEQVETIYRTKTLLTDADPLEQLDLPFDYEDVFIQNVAVTDGTGPFVTFDPNKWFLLQTGFAGKYINYVDVGGVLKPVITLYPDLFPSTNNDATNGHWYFRVAITRKSLPQPSPQASNNAASNLGRTFLRYRFIPVCVGSITAIFFGSIPMPGMTATATLNGKTVTGIIESVQFNSPGTITVNIVQWARMEFNQQLAAFDNTAAIKNFGG